MLMAVKYVPRFGGYIVDVPYFYFKRADNKVFVNKHVTQCSLSPQTDFIEVRSGWSSYASANIPGQSTMDIQITLGDFMPELFSMANATDPTADATFKVPITEHKTPDETTHAVTLTYAPVDGSVYINGLEEMEGSGDVTSGKFKVDATNKTVTFNAEETDEMEIYYETVDQSTNASVIDINNKDSACGEVILKWPIYNDSKDCKDSGIIKYAVVRIFKARVTTAPGFDTSLASCRLLAA